MAISEAFETLSDAWQNGRPVIPLFGAGLSSGSGIPLTEAMVSYLAKVHWYFSLKGRSDLLEPRETAAVILEHGWPEPHELNETILREWQDHFKLLQDYNQRDKRKPTLPNVVTARDILPAIGKRVLRELHLEDTDSRWLVLLQQLSDGQQELKDLLFARLERDRRPATAHQFAAHLSGLMGWHFLATTNFDVLLEQALRNQGLYPTIYELPDQRGAPDPRLVTSHFSIVKLHGGTFGRLMSETLNYSLSLDDRGRLLKYFPPNPLVLVLGYGGGDQRVMSLIEALLRDESVLYPPGLHSVSPNARVLWIYRTNEPPLMERIRKRLGSLAKRLLTFQYRNGGRFLQEFYCRLATSHPVSATLYRVFPHMAPRTPMSEKVASLLTDAPVVLFHASESGSGTSTSMAKEAENLTHEIIWCDLETIATVDGLVTYLQNRFRRFDPDLPPFAYFQTEGKSLSALSPDQDPRVWYIVRAMRRGRYVIAIDSLGEFGISFSSYASQSATVSKEPQRVVEEANRLLGFLKSLIESRAEFGESRLFIAHTRLNTGGTGMDPKVEAAWDSYLKWLRQQDATLHAGIRFLESNRDETLAKLNVEAKGLPPVKGNDLVRWTSVVWKQWETKDVRKNWALALASCFRRRRDLVVLRRLLFKVICPQTRSQYSSLEGLFGAAREFTISGWECGLGHKDRTTIDNFLDMLEPLLIRQEGGFYWMHRIIRDETYRLVRDKVQRFALADFHDLIAAYYYSDVFLPSNDTAAFFEYVFHRLLSLSTDKKKDRIHRLWDLVVVLKRERDHLLREDIHPGTLRRCLNRCRDAALWDQMAQSSRVNDLWTAQAELRRVLCELEAETCRQAFLHDECIEIRHRQISDRLLEILRKCGKGNCEQELNRLTDELRAGNVFVVLSELVQMLVPKLAANPSLAVELFRELFRLLDHVIEIGACQFALGNEETGLLILEQVRFVSRYALQEVGADKKNVKRLQVLLDSANELKSQSALDEQLQHAPKSLKDLTRFPPELANQVYDARVRCVQRMMEMNLWRISPWDKPTDPSSPTYKETKSLLTEAIKEFRRGEMALQKYTGWQDRQYHHYVCFLNTLRARAAYLQIPKGEFALAYLFLDRARDAIPRPVRGSDHSALAIIHMHKAECLMLHADHELSLASAATESFAAAGAKLERARTALEQARASLVRGRPHVWAWTWLRVLDAQLEHEQIVWSFEDKSPDRLSPGRIDRAFRTGLNSLRIGLDSCRHSKRRYTEIQILWWQLFVCWIAKSGKDPDILSSWTDLNKATDLLAFLDRLTPTIEEVRSWIQLPDVLTRAALLNCESEILRREGMPLFGKLPPSSRVDRPQASVVVK